MGKWGTGKVEKECLKCNKVFLGRKDRLGKFCSKSCGSSFKPKRYLRIWKKCQVCFLEFEVKKYREKTALYCSSLCRQKRMPKKENHPNWKGGIARTWKSKNIIKRLVQQKGKCEMCRSVKFLQGHHVIPYSEDKNLIEDENNIQILCINCHALQHPKISSFILKGDCHE